MENTLLQRIRRRAVASVGTMLFAVAALALPPRTCDWEESNGCVVAVTQTNEGYSGSRECNGTYYSFGGAGTYGVPEGATCTGN